MAAVAVALIGFTACNKTDQGKGEQTPVSEAKEFLVSAGMKDYSNWTYVNLKTGQTETHRDFSAWNYFKMGKEGPVLVKTEPAKGKITDVKIEWHIAIHPKAIRTNETEAAVSNDTDIKTAKVPAAGSFVKDGEVKNKLITDLSGMMSGGPIGFASVAKGNEVLTKWVKKTPTGEHGKATYELSDKVFFVKCKDGSLVKVKFTDYRNAEGSVGFCRFKALEVKGK